MRSVNDDVTKSSRRTLLPLTRGGPGGAASFTQFFCISRHLRLGQTPLGENFDRLGLGNSIYIFQFA